MHKEILQSPWLIELMAFHINLRETNVNSKKAPALSDGCDGKAPALLDGCDTKAPALFDGCDTKAPALFDGCDTKAPALFNGCDVVTQDGKTSLACELSDDINYKFVGSIKIDIDLTCSICLVGFLVSFVGRISLFCASF
jgi:hypothetical protein